MNKSTNPSTSHKIHTGTTGLAPLVLQVLFGAVAVIFIVLTGLSNIFDHDEHQFVAAGKLLVDHGLLPYIDYPYFQMPNLVLVNGLIFLFSDHLLLGARLFSILCSITSVFLIFHLTKEAFGSGNEILRLLVSSSMVLLLLLNPVYLLATGKAWNHDSMVCLLLLSYWAAILVFEKTCSTKWVFMTAFFVGLAAGFRVSGLPMIIPVWVAVSFFVKRNNLREHLSAQVFFVTGLLSALIPSILFFAADPNRFLFNVFGYHTLVDQVYLRAMGRSQTHMQILNEVVSVAMEDRMKPLIIVFIVSFPIAILASFIKRRFPFGLFLSLLFIIFQVGGFFLKNIIFPQYFYAPIPFLILAVVFALSSTHNLLRWALIFVLTVAVLTTVILYGKAFLDSKKLHEILNWPPVLMRELSLEISAKAGPGRVLTLSPIFPLEGGLDIYPELTTGPFAWRVAGFVPNAERKKYRFFTQEELPKLIGNDLPDAVFTGFEGNLDKPLEEYAEANNYTSVKVTMGKLWIRSK